MISLPGLFITAIQFDSVALISEVIVVASNIFVAIRHILIIFVVVNRLRH